MQEALEGKTLGRYQLQRRIGLGGMAEVYLAYDEHLHREIAVKIVHRRRTDDLARFQREAGTLASLTHEHILPVYDYGQEGPWHYLIMPYINYGTLADRLCTRGPFSPIEAGLLLEQIADALQYAHDHGILHRDIKSSNILLRDDFYAYLADFGIAKSLEQESGLTQAGTFIGTPEYMAPELFEEPASRNSDIYALGIVLYNMLTGRLPFTGPNPLAIMEKQLHEPPIPLSQLIPTITPSVEQVILCALEKDPRRRFQSARAFSNAYLHALQDPMVLAAQPRRATSDFHADSTMAFAPTSSITAGLRSPSSDRSIHASRIVYLVMLGVFVLLLGLAGPFLLPLLLGHHLSGQPSGPTTTTALPPRATTPLPPTATRPTLTCSVNDSANILDQNQVCQQAQSLLSYSLVVHTSNSSNNDDSSTLPQTQFIDANTIVITIVVNRSHHKHDQQTQVTITGGNAVPLTHEQYQSAVEAFNQAAHGGNYTSATIIAIQSLQASGAYLLSIGAYG